MFVVVFAIALTYGDPVPVALKRAARNGNMVALSSIVQSMGRGGIDLEPAFMEASAYGRIKAMKFLVAKGAVDVRGALIKASSRNQVHAVRYLLELDEHIDELDVELARLVAGGSDSLESEFVLLTHRMLN